MSPCPRPSNQLLGHEYNNHMQILVVSSQHREYLCHMFQGNAVSSVSSQNWMIVFIERQNHQLHSHKYYGYQNLLHVYLNCRKTIPKNNPLDLSAIGYKTKRLLDFPDVSMHNIEEYLNVSLSLKNDNNQHTHSKKIGPGTWIKRASTCPDFSRAQPLLDT